MGEEGNGAGARASAGSVEDVGETIGRGGAGERRAKESFPVRAGRAADLGAECLLEAQEHGGVEAQLAEPPGNLGCGPREGLVITAGLLDEGAGVAEQGDEVVCCAGRLGRVAVQEQLARLLEAGCDVVRQGGDGAQAFGQKGERIDGGVLCRLDAATNLGLSLAGERVALREAAEVEIGRVIALLGGS